MKENDVLKEGMVLLKEDVLKTNLDALIRERTRILGELQRVQIGISVLTNSIKVETPKEKEKKKEDATPTEQQK